MKIEPYKWQFVFRLQKRYHMIEGPGWRLFTFGIFKIIEPLKEAYTIQSHKRKGFIINFMIWFPIDSQW